MAQTIEKQGDYYILGFDNARADGVTAVSETHLTLPTN